MHFIFEFFILIIQFSQNNFRVAKPTAEEAEALEEILAKRHKRGKVTEEKPMEEKSTLHSE